VAQRDRDASGQRHKWTGTRTETHMDSDRKRETDRQGYKRTWTRTQTDRDVDGQGQGHIVTGKGTQTDRDTDLDIANYNGQLKKKRWKVIFFKNWQNRILSANAINRFKYKRSSLKLTFSKWKISAVPLIDGQRKLCPALSNGMNSPSLLVHLLGLKVKVGFFKEKAWRWWQMCKLISSWQNNATGKDSRKRL
jgi:hypothetical protein